jgi:hypothetical protein
LIDSSCILLPLPFNWGKDDVKTFIYTGLFALENGKYHACLMLKHYDQPDRPLDCLRLLQSSNSGRCPLGYGYYRIASSTTTVRIAASAMAAISPANEHTHMESLSKHDFISAEKNKKIDFNHLKLLDSCSCALIKA